MAKKKNINLKTKMINCLRYMANMLDDKKTNDKIAHEQTFAIQGNHEMIINQNTKDGLMAVSNLYSQNMDFNTEKWNLEMILQADATSEDEPANWQGRGRLVMKITFKYLPGWGVEKVVNGNLK